MSSGSSSTHGDWIPVRLVAVCLALVLQCPWLAAIGATAAPAKPPTDPMAATGQRKGTATEGAGVGAVTEDASALAQSKDAQSTAGSEATFPQSPKSQAPAIRAAKPAEEKTSPAPGYRLEYLTLGAEVFYGLGIFAEVGSLFWRHLMVVPLRIQGSYQYAPVLVPALRVGSLMGFGGAHGQRGQFSHWFLIGAELIFAQGRAPWLGPGNTRLVGWLLPLGYELRYRLVARREQSRSLGFRILVAFMPLYTVRYRDGICPPYQLLCNSEAPRISWPLAVGISVFYAFGHSGSSRHRPGSK